MANAAQWQDLSKRQQEIFGSQEAFRAAKQALRKEGGDVSKVLQIKNMHRQITSTLEPTAETSSNEPDINALRAKVGLPPLSEEELQKEKDRIAQDKAYGEHLGSLSKEERERRVEAAGGYRKYRELFDKGEHESDSLKIQDTTEDETPRFRDDVNELGQDGIIDKEDEQQLVENWGQEKVDDKLETIVDKKDYEFSEEFSDSLKIQDTTEDTEPVTTEDTESTQTEDETPRFRDDVNELGQDGVIDAEDKQELVENWGQEKVDDKLETIVDKKDYEFSEEVSESLGIADNSGESENRFRDDVKELGDDGYIDSDEERELVETWGQEKVDDKLETITDKKDIEIGENIYKDGGLNINEPEQAERVDDVDKTGPKAFQSRLDEYYEEGLEKYEGRMQKFAEDYNSNKGLKRYKGKKDESGRNKIQREYKDKRTEDAKAYDKDKSKFQKDKLNSLYEQRRDLLDDKGMVKRPSLDVSTTPNPYEGAINEVKQALGIKKPDANYLKDQVKSALTLKINKPDFNLKISEKESTKTFTAKQFTKPDYSYKPRT